MPLTFGVIFLVGWIQFSEEEKTKSYSFIYLIIV